jgi:hypothetical protein
VLTAIPARSGRDVAPEPRRREQPGSPAWARSEYIAPCGAVSATA